MAPHPDCRVTSENGLYTIHNQRGKVAFTWTGEGNPLWRGKPDVNRLRRIMQLTAKYRQDRMYWDDHGSWRRLDGPGYVEEYRRLNLLLGGV